jgi:hypothetical protein
MPVEMQLTGVTTGGAVAATAVDANSIVPTIAIATKRLPVISPPR